jgi:Ras-related protein Rab-7A
MERFVAQKFTSQYKATIGADFSTKDVTVGNELITLQIWDTAGQERYQSLGTAFYRGADACVLVYDVSDALSFQKLESWRTAFLNAADIKDPQTFPFVVLGNKADLDAPKQVVQAASVKAWCDKHNNIPSFAVSAKTGDNVETAFLSVVKAAAARVKEEEPISEYLRIYRPLSLSSFLLMSFFCLHHY